MTTLFTERLVEYARTLQAAGFTVYRPVLRHGAPRQFFHYSRVVNGRECFGTVQEARDRSLEHLMPIKPTRDNGSSMIVILDHASNTVEAAEQVARPMNQGPWVSPREQVNAKPWGIGDRYVPLEVDEDVSV